MNDKNPSTNSEHIALSQEDSMNTSQDLERKKEKRKKYFNIALLILFGVFIGQFGESWYEELVREGSEQEFEVSIEPFEEIEESINNQENILEKHYPFSCTSSSEHLESSHCEEVYFKNRPSEGWHTNDGICYKEFLTFDFPKNIYLEFIVLQNYEERELFEKYGKIKELKILFPNSDYPPVYFEMENDTTSQWIDINYEISTLTFEIKSHYEKDEDSKCALSEITFYGRSLNK